MKPTYLPFTLLQSLCICLAMLTLSCQNEETEIQPTANTDIKVVENKESELVDSAYSMKVLKVDSLDLIEVNENFTFKGSLINPIVFHSFIPWISDPIPSCMALDIMASNNANLFYTTGAVSLNKDGYVVVENNSDLYPTADTFRYKWLGRLDNAIHILECIEENESSSGIFINLVFLQFELSDFSYNGLSYTQLMMKNKGELGIGDRTTTKITLHPKSNKVTVKTLDQDSKKWLSKEIQL